VARAANHGFGVTPGQRFATGCIVTYTDGTVRHFTGSGHASTRAAAEYADLHDLHVRTISTPQTVYRDLHGSREQMVTDSDKTHRSVNLNLPEVNMFGAIGRKDLLA
jgi:hypothetical protein